VRAAFAQSAPKRRADQIRAGMRQAVTDRNPYAGTPDEWREKKDDRPFASWVGCSTWSK
jgi:hypothetical protein